MTEEDLQKIEDERRYCVSDWNGGSSCTCHNNWDKAVAEIRRLQKLVEEVQYE